MRAHVPFVTFDTTPEDEAEFDRPPVLSREAVIELMARRARLRLPLDDLRDPHRGAGGLPLAPPRPVEPRKRRPCEVEKTPEFRRRRFLSKSRRRSVARSLRHGHDRARALAIYEERRRTTGPTGGHPPLTEREKDEIVRLYLSGLSVMETARRSRRHRWTVYAVLEERRVPRRTPPAPPRRILGGAMEFGPA